jgi:hypothetical protein
LLSNISLLLPHKRASQEELHKQSTQKAACVRQAKSPPVTLLGQAFAHTILPQIQPRNKPTTAATSGAYYNISSSMWIPELESDEESTATKQSK